MRVIYLDVDSLRPDHTGPYGYERKTTPNLDEWAKKAVVFERYYCSDSPCLPSRAALSSGQFGITNGAVGHFGRAAELRFGSYPDTPTGHDMHPKGRPLLGGHLNRNGLYTASVSCFAERHIAYWFLGNFRESIKPTLSLGNDEDGADVNRAAFGWLERNALKKDWFLHLNYWEPHTTYIEPEEWFEKAAESGPAPAWPDEDAIAAHQEIYGPHSAVDLNYLDGGSSPNPRTQPEAIANRADFEKLVNGYDGEVMYWDHLFGQLLNKLDDLGILEETAIILSADHGESMGENGSYAEHGLANEPTHRVPLIVRWPGITDDLPAERRRSGALLLNVDLGPTLCDLLGLSVPSGWQGESFADAVRGDEVRGRDHLIMGQGAHTYQRAVRTRDHLYVRTLHPGNFKAEWESLFDVSRDRFLTRNLIEEEPAIADAARARLSEWWHDHAGVPGALPDPMQATLDQGPYCYSRPYDYLQHLRATGRKHQASDLEQRLGRVVSLARQTQR